MLRGVAKVTERKEVRTSQGSDYEGERNIKEERKEAGERIQEANQQEKHTNRGR